MDAVTLPTMPRSRRLVVIVAGMAIVWYVCVLVFWALQPLEDSVPVGIDHTRGAPAPVSVPVDCNTLFAGSARDASPLPALTPQPQPAPALAYQREPCALAHRQARVVFGLDTVVLVSALVGCGWLAVGKRTRVRESSTTALSTA